MPRMVPLEEEVSTSNANHINIEKLWEKWFEKGNNLQIWDTMASETTFTFPCTSRKPHVELERERASQQLRLFRMELPLSLVVRSLSLEVLKKRPETTHKGYCLRHTHPEREDGLNDLWEDFYDQDSRVLLTILRIPGEVWEAKGIKTENHARMWSLVGKTDRLGGKNMSRVLRDKGESTSSYWKDL